MHRLIGPIAALVLAASLLAAGPLMAGRDHEEIRRLRGAGQILSLETIIAELVNAKATQSEFSIIRDNKVDVATMQLALAGNP